MSLRAPAGLPPLPVSAEALERITANLVSNAVRAVQTSAVGSNSTPRRSVWITLQAREGSARLSVEDSGPGMADSVAARFLQPDRAAEARRPDGHGLGHRIVHGLVVETGGRLGIRPRPAGGTVVTVVWALPSSSTLRVVPSQSAAEGYGMVIAC